MKKVLTINECFSDNLGDQAIALSLKTLLEEHEFEVIQADYSGNELNLSNRIVKSSINKVNVKSKLIKLIKKIEIIRLLGWCINNFKRLNKYASKDFDFAVIGGGQLILSNPHFPIALFLWTFILDWNKKDIYIFSVGSGDSFNRLERFLIKKSLNRVKAVFVRDDASYHKFKDTFKIISEVIPDVAYSFPSTKKITENKEYTIVGIVDYAVYKRYASEVDLDIVSEVAYMQLWVDKIKENHFKRIILLATTYTDLALSRRFYDYICAQKLDVDITFDDKLLTLEQYCAHLRTAKSVFSGRMHSLILAERFDCIPIPWRISKKIYAYEAEVNSRGSVNEANIKLKETIHTICKFYNDEI